MVLFPLHPKGWSFHKTVYMKDIYREFYEEEIKCKVDDNAPKNMEEKQVNVMKNILPELLKHIKTTPKEELEREFKEIEEWSNVGPTVEEFMDFYNKVNKKPQYPKNYAECCKALGITSSVYMVYDEEYKTEVDYLYTQKALANNFLRLKICRDAYWKIAGEEMGLDKPWNPDWENLSTNHEFIKISKGCFIYSSRVLVFPTEEMRDVFFENFKDLIESCKELL